MAGIPIMIYPPGLLDNIRTIAVKHPSLRLILDHLALPLHTRGVDFDQHVGELVELASCGNVGVKESALPLYSKVEFPFEDLHRGLHHLITAFTPDRVLWGSDMTGLKCTYREAVEMMAKALPELSEADRDLLMGRTLSEWLRWPEGNPAS